LSRAQAIETPWNRYRIQVPILRNLLKLTTIEGNASEHLKILRELTQLHDLYGAIDEESEAESTELALILKSARRAPDESDTGV
jgi:hypothetical protein